MPQTKLMLIGASNLWFPATLSIIVMPESAEEKAEDLADRIRAVLGDKLAKYAGSLDILRDFLDAGGVDVTGLSDGDLSVRWWLWPLRRRRPPTSRKNGCASGIRSTCSSRSGVTC